MLSIGPVTCSNCYESDLYFRQSTDHGATFSAPVIIEPSPTGYNFRIQYEFLLVDPNRNINTVWEDSTAYGGEKYDILFSRSADAGKSFSPPVRISNAAAFDSTTSAVIDSSGNVYAAWADLATRDVFFTRDFAPGFTLSAAPVPATVLPGGTASFSFTLTPTGGFSNAVNLSCTNLPPSAQCTFNPSSLAPNTSGSQVTLTIATPPTLAQGNYSSQSARRAAISRKRKLSN